MIVVSGASGGLGRRTVEHLLERVDAARVTALSRRPHTVADLGVRTGFADFGDPDSLRRGFDGAERLLLISVGGDRRYPLHERAVRAAVAAGVGEVVFTSFTRAADPGNPNRHVAEFAATERLLAESGLPFTVLRFNLWPDVLLDIGVAPRAVATGILPSNAGDGRVAHLTRDDSADAAAAVLAEGGHRGQILEVGGSAAVSDADLARALTDATGRPVRYEPVTDERITSALLAQGLPDPVAHGWGRDGIAKREGWFDVITHTVDELTGRPATTLTEFLATHRARLLAARA